MNDVLIVGAGPTGLTLAAQLQAQGVRPRVVERRREPAASRAFVVHPRTLELLAGLGVAEAVVAAGDPAARVRLHASGRSAGVSLVSPGQQDTAYPFLLFIPQSQVEAVLESHLRHEGVVVERGVEFTGLERRRDVVQFTLRGDDGAVEEGVAAYVIGCDGRDSTVRDAAGITFESRAYRPTLVLADVDVDGDLAPGHLHGYVAGAGLLFLFPSPTGAGWRLLTVGPPATSTRDVPGSGELQAVADHMTGGALRLHEPDWSARMWLRRGQAAGYRHGRVLLAGDAAHLHSPAGAQGMNTGIQDACNLAWKLALVVRGAAPAALLDSYEAERWSVARRIRQLTDLAFLLEAADHAPLRWLRAHATPVALPLVRDRALPRVAFRLLGGLSTRYRRSPIVEEGVPRLRRGPRVGDRLPDGRIHLAGKPRRLHELLGPPVHHLLLCGPPDGVQSETLTRFQQDQGMPLRVHRLSRMAQEGGLEDPEGQLLRRLGVRGTAVYLVRPDGYIAYRAAGTSLEGVTHHIHELRRRGATTDRRRHSNRPSR